MVRKSTITFATSAVKDVEELRAWYADQQAPDVVERLLREIISRIEALADFPESRRIVPEFRINSLLEIIHPPFRIVYRFEQNRVRIVRIWRSERLLQLP
jgi:plasmid stabilization system protein ParE